MEKTQAPSTVVRVTGSYSYILNFFFIYLLFSRTFWPLFFVRFIKFYDRREQREKK